MKKTESDKVTVYIHKCNSPVSKFMHLFHDYQGIPKFSHYALSYISDYGNKMVIDATEKNVAETHINYFKKRWEVVGQDHLFEVDKFQFMNWKENLLGREYGYWSLVGHGFKKLFHLKSNPFGDGKKKVICNEIALMFVNKFFNANVDPESYDLVETELIIDAIQNK